MVAFRYTSDRRLVLFAGIGSILPDLIDKPLGHIILKGSLDYGRIYAHSVLFLLALVLVGITYQRWKGSWIILVLALGVLSHLLLDSMWELPVTLFYPLLGDFGIHHFPNYVEDSLVQEIENAYEWIFGAFSLAILLFTYRDKLGKFGTCIEGPGLKILRALSMVLVLVGTLSLLFGAISTYNPLSMTDNVEANLIIGATAFLGGLASQFVLRSTWSETI